MDDPLWEGGRSAVDFYFNQEDGETFKATLTQSPYFLVACKSRTEPEVEEYLRRKFENTIERVVRLQKEDLDLVILVDFVFVFQLRIIIYLGLNGPLFKYFSEILKI